MGRAKRARPEKMGRKLALIRTRLGLTQPELIKALKAKGENIYPSGISLYESGEREPSLLVLLAYSKLAGVTINDLVDDKVKLE